MAFTFVTPLSAKGHAWIKKHELKTYELIRGSVRDVWGVPETDIITITAEFKRIRVDPKCTKLKVLPDCLIRVYTSDKKYKRKARKLTTAILTRWQSGVVRKLKVEIWISFFDTWGTNIVIPYP